MERNKNPSEQNQLQAEGCNSFMHVNERATNLSGADTL